MFLLVCPPKNRKVCWPATLTHQLTIEGMPRSKEADAARKREKRGAEARDQEKVALQSEARADASARAQEKVALQSEARANASAHA